MIEEKNRDSLCVVCGMTINPASPYASTTNGITHYFCSEFCKEAFEANPQKFIKKISPVL